MTFDENLLGALGAILFIGAIPLACGLSYILDKFIDNFDVVMAISCISFLGSCVGAGVLMEKSGDRMNAIYQEKERQKQDEIRACILEQNRDLKTCKFLVEGVK